MKKAIATPARWDVMAARRAIHRTWSERERHRRRMMAERKQQTLFDLLASSESSTSGRHLKPEIALRRPSKQKDRTSC